MLKKQIQNDILTFLGFEPTAGQLELSEALADFTIYPKPNSCILVKGYAGTGKTSLLAGFVKALSKYRKSYQLLAPTGRAAKVIGEYAGIKAQTIHKCIYRQKSMADGMGRFVLNYNKFKDTTFIIDESSMIANQSYEDSAFGSGKLLSDLVEFVNQGRNCRLIFIGDTAQLPPVGLEVSPALDTTELELLGLEVQEFTLNEVVRQSLQSGILVNATSLREIIDNPIVDFPKFNIQLSDFSSISSSEILELLTDEYYKQGRDANVVICYSNKRANRYNEAIRQRILFYEEELSVGDYLMVARNNYFWVEDRPEIGFIANGDIVQVTRIGKRYDLYGFRFADITIRLIDENDQEIDVRVVLDSLRMGGPSLGQENMRKLYQQVALDYQHIKTARARYKKIKEDPFFNALQVKFAYAITCHKAQGGQWPNVFIDQGFFKNDMLTREYLRWLYTAITRATRQVYLVDFDKLFFK